MSIAAYKSNIRQTESPRQIERRILSRLTGALEAYAAYDKTTSSQERLDVLCAGLREALAENQKFWNALKFDLASPENGLSPDLRSALVSIAIWVDRKTSTVLSGGPGVMALAEINRTIITGLSGNAAQPAPVSMGAPSPTLHPGE